MRTLGLTGGIGSGKSVAAAMLAEKPGVRVVYADAVAKRLMAEDPAVRAALVARFGPGVYDAAGALDRRALAARVFGRPDELAALNAVVHPATRRAMLAEIERARAEGVRLLVYEAALIFETGAEAHLDGVAAVYAPIWARIARVMKRDGLTREGVVERMRHQLPPAELRRRADVVLENDGPLAHLRAQVDLLYARLLLAGA